MFERSVEFFFDNRYGGYMLDDELISSKASDIEHKVVSDRKSEGKGPKCDCFCDSYVQLMLGMRVRSSGDTQLFNMEMLSDTLPAVAPNAASAFGPILAPWVWKETYSGDVCKTEFQSCGHCQFNWF
jgi:hypothetical protein